MTIGGVLGRARKGPQTGVQWGLGRDFGQAWKGTSEGTWEPRHQPHPMRHCAPALPHLPPGTPHVPHHPSAHVPEGVAPPLHWPILAYVFWLIRPCPNEKGASELIVLSDSGSVTPLPTMKPCRTVWLTRQHSRVSKLPPTTWTKSAAKEGKTAHLEIDERLAAVVPATDLVGQHGNVHPCCEIEQADRRATRTAGPREQVGMRRRPRVLGPLRCDPATHVPAYDSPAM